MFYSQAAVMKPGEWYTTGSGDRFQKKKKKMTGNITTTSIRKRKQEGGGKKGYVIDIPVQPSLFLFLFLVMLICPASLIICLHNIQKGKKRNMNVDVLFYGKGEVKEQQCQHVIIITMLVWTSPKAVAAVRKKYQGEEHLLVLLYFPNLPLLLQGSG